MEFFDKTFERAASKCSSKSAGADRTRKINSESKSPSLDDGKTSSNFPQSSSFCERSPQAASAESPLILKYRVSESPNISETSKCPFTTSSLSGRRSNIFSLKSDDAAKKPEISKTAATKAAAAILWEQIKRVVLYINVIFSKRFFLSFWKS